LILSQATKKFLITLTIYTIAILTFDYLTHNFAPAHQNNEKQGQSQQLQGGQGEMNRPVEPAEPSYGDEVSRGKAIKGREMVVESTSYSHTGQRTFSGTWPVEGRTIAVDGKVIPIGSKVFIYELNNWYLAEDLIPPSSVRKGAIIDIFRNDEKSCWEWGRRSLRVWVMPPEKANKGK
jgi:3D (Asp-Asp-Asp) domain-containing protein